MHYVSNEDSFLGDGSPLSSLTENETIFLQWICSDKTYKEIAEEMHISPRTVDTYRDNLFKKLDIKTRVGLAIFAIKHGIVSV